MSLKTLARLPLSAVRRLRWRVGAWSKDSDRGYHDQLYSGDDYDPFCVDYPGYVTIRRFADHAEFLLPASGTVLDVGCGPGEITCELARRHPHLQFFGIDHSERAVERAGRNARRLGLSNVRFEAGDAESLASGGTFGLVVMFDAFHHLEHPERFLSWLRARASRCLLIEPAGTPTGRWARDLDLDWLLLDIGRVRERLERIAGAEAVVAPSSEPAPARRGEGAVERRYAVDDFVRFFAGWQLRITGTVAGFDTYPTQPHARGPLRRVAGDAAYEFVRATEHLLLEHDLDGAAKHWVIAAAEGPGVVQPRLPSRRVPTDEAPAAPMVAGACDIRYVAVDVPIRANAGSSFKATVEIANDGWDTWRSDNGRPVYACYHWLARDGVDVVEFNGRRTPLPRPVGPGETCRVMMTVEAPGPPASYVLAIDFVREGVTWFSEAGAPWHAVKVTVRA